MKNIFREIKNLNFYNIIKASLIILFGIVGMRMVVNMIVNRSNASSLLLRLVVLPLLFMAVWRWVFFAGLLPAAFFIWQQQQLFSYSFLEPFLFKASIPEVAMYVLIIIHIVKNLRKPFYAIPFTNLLKFYVAIAFVVSFFGIAPDKDVVIVAMRRCILAPVCAYILVNTLKSKKDIERLMLSFLAGTTLLSILSILAFHGCFEMLEWHATPWYTEAGRTVRLAAAYYIPIIGGMDLGGNMTVIFSSFAIPMAVSLWLCFKGNILKRCVALITIAANFIVVVIAGSRAVWIGVIISCILVALLHGKKIPVLVIKRALFLVCIFLAVIFLLYQMGYISSEIINRASDVLQVLLLKAGAYDYFVETSGGRDIIWKEGLRAAVRYPFGTGFMESFAPAGGLNVGPHTQYVFLLLGTGVIGVCIFLTFLWFCARRFFYSRYTDDLASRWIVIGAAGAIAAYLFDAGMIHTYLVPGADIALYMICGAGVAIAEKSRSVITE